jgi:Putative peptidoglycan binding domain
MTESGVLAQRTIKQGEHVSRIAAEHGFHNYRTLWDHAENQTLKELRRNPNVLFPGDRLFIPDLEDRVEPGATEQRHSFRLHVTPLMLRVVLRTVDGEPIRHTDCELLLNLTRIPLVTDNNGMIEQEIPKDAADVKLLVPTQGLEFALKIGHLDPVEEFSGEQARLNNLGYFAGYSAADTKQLRWAVEEFQCEHHLPVTGVYDEATRAKLEKDYGC